MEKGAAEAEQLAGEVAALEAAGKAAGEKAQALGRMVAEVGGWEGIVWVSVRFFPRR